MSTRSQAIKSKKGQCVCPICDEKIKDTVGQKTGDDAVECDGVCASWVHRRCAGLSKVAYNNVSKSPNPLNVA